jgi:hypothetical protein
VPKGRVIVSRSLTVEKAKIEVAPENWTGS